MSGSSDDWSTELQEWVDSASAGGLPSPRLRRWQALRAGVVGLWEFEVTEYWFANGWAQLTGSNESGKSSLMALTTLIPWLADTSSVNIDTLGRSGKKFRYYVEATGADGDRRSVEASANGSWLWVEYGSLTSEGPRFFTTLLHAETRSAAADVGLTWCTAEGTARVRAGLPLAVTRDVASPGELAQPGWIQHPSATAYRTHVAERLLGSTAERLEAVGKMLRVTRTPKLGAQLEIGFVQQHLRTALPELSRTEIDALANGWDQLDQIRADLATTRDAAETLERFRREAWLPWVRAALRQRADRAGSTRTRLDNVTRDEAAARQEVVRAEAEQTLRASESAAAREEAAAARASADELLASSRYADAQSRLASLEQHRRQLVQLRHQHDQDEEDRARAAAAEERDEVEVEEARSEVTTRTQEADASREQLVRTLADVVAQDATTDGELDLARTGQALVDRRQQVDGALNLAAAVESSDRLATTAEEVAAVRRDTARADGLAMDAAWAQAEEMREALSRVVTVWAGDARPAVPADVVDAWLGALPRSSEPAVAGRPDLTGAIRSDWYDPARQDLTARRERVRFRERQTGTEIERLTTEIAALTQARTPVHPPPLGWQRRARPDEPRSGGPLWALVDPRSDIADPALAALEAALAAMGLLDAWVTPDGTYRATRDGDDLVVTPPRPVAGVSLADRLSPADPTSALGRVVGELLVGIALVPAGTEPSPEPSGPDAPTRSPLMVSDDGRWWSPGLTGRARALHDQPEWVGESARAARRRRRVAELSAELDERRSEAEAVAAELIVVDLEIGTLEERMRRAPSDAPLRAALTQAQERSRTAERSEASADSSEADARARRATADEQRAELARFCSSHRLPSSSDRLRDARIAVGQAETSLKVYGGLLARQAGAVTQLARAEGRRTTSARLRQDLDVRVADGLGRIRTTQATIETLAATIGADDREVLDRLSRLRETEDEARRRHDELTAQLRELGESLGGARTRLLGIETERERARDARDASYAEFRLLLDRGFDTELGLELPGDDGGGAERIRSQVAVVRREVSPRDWSGEPDQQDAVLRRLSLNLTKLLNEETRIRLEAGGRTLTLDYDEHALPQVSVLVDSNGTPLGATAAAVRLREIHDELARSYSRRVQETLDELLGSTFLEHLRDQLGTTENLITDINAVLAKHPVVTTKTSLKIVLEPVSPSDAAMLEAVTGPSMASPEVADRVRDRLRERVEEAKRLAEAQGDMDWRHRLAQQLDYRSWFEVALRKKVGADGRWTPLTTQGFAEMSGGARVVILMLPLVATLAALYGSMRDAPRPLWLDEAFDGLDSANREMVMDLFASFDLDVLLAGPARLVNVRTVPAAAIYQVVRAPAPLAGVDLVLELWAGGDLRQIDLPTTLPSGPRPGRLSGAEPEPPTDTLL